MGSGYLDHWHSFGLFKNKSESKLPDIKCSFIKNQGSFHKDESPAPLTFYCSPLEV